MRVIIAVPSSQCYMKKQAVKAPVRAVTSQVSSLLFRFGVFLISWELYIGQ